MNQWPWLISLTSALWLLIHNVTESNKMPCTSWIIKHVVKKSLIEATTGFSCLCEENTTIPQIHKEFLKIWCLEATPKLFSRKWYYFSQKWFCHLNCQRTGIIAYCHEEIEQCQEEAFKHFTLCKRWWGCNKKLDPYSQEGHRQAVQLCQKH